MSIYPCDIDGLRSRELLVEAFVTGDLEEASLGSCIECVTGMQSDIVVDTIETPITRLRT
jgi:hypothetical protein